MGHSVYYTPTYIVDYIVEQTVGQLVEGKKVGPRGGVSRLRILDPACGSGSFLLGAYQFLLDWHRDQYIQDDPHKWATRRTPRLYQTAAGDWQLTTAERKRILLNNIYGVDIDPQAVEVTKLSLLLKVLEGETGQSLSTQLSFLRERALPDLEHNIKCGNSLIGPDFYDGWQMSLLDEEEMYRLNIFDWEAGFPGIMAGGFDAVIGNPPYVRQEMLGDEKEYFQKRYRTFRPTADLYVNFIEKGLRLLKPAGMFGMIVSNKWLRAGYGRPLREFLVNDVAVLQVVDLAGLPVFANATVRTVVLICSNRPQLRDTIRYLAPVPMEDFRTIRSGEDLRGLVDQRAVDLPVSGLSPDGWSLSKPGSQRVLERIKQDAVTLHEYVDGKMFRGVVTGRNKVFVINQATRDRLISEDPGSAEIIKPVLAGRDIRRYTITFRDRYLVFTRRGINIGRFPSILNYLEQYRQDLTPKKTGKERHGRKPGKYEWYEIQDTIDYHAEFEKPKIIYPDIATTCRFTLDRDGYFGTNTTYFIPGDDLYLLGILNSKLGLFYFSEVCAGLIECCDHQMVALVERSLEMHKQLADAKLPQARTVLQRQGRQIDRLVYELYELTEEIRIVEEGVG